MQHWFITGTSSGLGKAIAELALQQNFVVHGFARRCNIIHPNYSHHIIDLSNIDAVENLQFESISSTDKIVLINNAGTTGEINYGGKLSNRIIADTYQLNIITPHILCNTFLKCYAKHPAKKVLVNVTSGAATGVYDGWSVYCATKAAMDMMSRCLAEEFKLANFNAKIFSIAPGVIDTPMQDALRKTPSKAFTRIDKFIDLKKDNKLADPIKVAQKYLDKIQDSDHITETIHRI